MRQTSTPSKENFRKYISTFAGNEKANLIVNGPPSSDHQQFSHTPPSFRSSLSSTISLCTKSSNLHIVSGKAMSICSSVQLDTNTCPICLG